MTYETEIDAIIAALNVKASEAIAREIAVSFLFGFRNTGTRQPLSNLQKNQIRKISQTNFGYMQDFNNALGEQLKAKVKEEIANGGGYSAIKERLIPEVEAMFGKDGQVVINNVGKERDIVTVASDGTLSRGTKTITREYKASINTYSDLMSRTVAKNAMEVGRVEGYAAQGLNKFQMAGPLDERTRAEHARAVGTIFESGTPEEEMIMDLISEPNCRHRIIPYLGEDINTSQEEFEARRDKAGVFFDENAGKWDYIGNK